MSVLVYTENWDGKFKKLSFELVSYSSALADMLGTTLTAVTTGSVDGEELRKLALYGADRILSINDERLKNLDDRLCTSVLAELAQSELASVVVFSNNNTGKALAPRLSVRLKAGIAPGVSGLPLSTDPFTISKRTYSGNAFARLVIKTDVRILTLARNSYGVSEKPKDTVPEQYSATVDASLASVEVKEVMKQTGKILLTDADIVVSGGRGMKSPDNWKPLEELAEALGGATACSRPVSDEGWRPHEEHTGQTGKIIAPNLYVAVGISGATQHLAGVSSSKCIVAINTDKDAPVFSAARYGIVGDAMKVLPALVAAAKEIKK
ncbi:MAG: electron transfer flavoprotein subunit alpha/FixB family protein [Bacteroidales bacterium]|jgi:electron transfer flavoprotein alpha subunit|nr:electron transfer flavoprotein subunit alpha/FixB family protein [Bacteroidales bacterium]